MMSTIMILEDDELLNGGLCYNLMLAGFQADPAKDIREAKEKFVGGQYDLLIVDVNLPDGSGLDFSRWVRERSAVPLMFLTARDMDDDMIEGFEAGADDYMTKPFNIRVLLQRVQAIIRRTGGAAETEQKYRCGNLEFDFNSHIVRKKDAVITLTPTEYKLLHKFCHNPGTVLTRQVLLEDLWDQHGNYVDEHTLTINVSRLRSKIADDQYTYIKTVYGLGYQWIGEKDE